MCLCYGHFGISLLDGLTAILKDGPGCTRFTMIDELAEYN